MKLLPAAALLGALLAFLPRPAAARAGGGGHYSGGGSFSHSSGGSWGSSSGGHSTSSSYGSSQPLTPEQRRLQHLFLLLILLVVLSVLVLNAFADQAPPGARDAFTASESAAPVEPLTRKDPEFDARAFLARAGGSLVQIQQAWSAGDMRPVRHLLSDGVFGRFQILLAMDRRMGLVNRLSDVRSLGGSIAAVEAGDPMDTLHARLTASAVDRYVSAATGETVQGDDAARPFTEIWSFVRSSNARTRPKGLAEGLCPSCGAPLQLTQATACGACGSWVNSGEFDWVLAEITQTSEWRIRTRLPDSFRALAAADPGLCAEALEDRASVAFWRYQLALLDSSIKPLAALAGETYRGTLAAPGLGGIAYADCAVGSAEVCAARLGEPQDQVDVRVRWSGRPVAPDKAGAAGTELSSARGPWDMIVTLARRHGAKTAGWTGLRATHCPACGAAAEELDRFLCAYCGRALADPERDWVLAGITA